MKYKAVIFDCFGVLYNDWSFDLFEILGNPKKAKRIRALMDKHDVNEVETDQYRRELEELSGFRFDTLVKKLQGNPNKTIVEITQSLQNTGYKVAMLSNVHKDYLDELLERDDLVGLFDEVLASSEVEAMKPDPEIYQTVLERLAIKPEEAIFIDDRKANVRGANKLGLSGVQFTTNDELVRQLESLLEIKL